ncbi:MAG: twin-arginine translocation signal domain-containing protein, partial [Deltaproteobacteria bacterium]|nr:twin-arginine translocation signal domain-containing protein [Deltaproteobacteria bacterium]
MLILKPPDIPSREITPEALYISRRRFIQTGAVLGAGLALGAAGWSRTVRAAQKGLGKITPGTPVAGETLTPYVHATSYNNFYELGTDKEDPAKNAGRLVTDPWSIVVDGEVAK